MLSLVIITRDEAASIARCIGSVPCADEVVVLDSGSTDGTPEIARALGARVTVADGPWPGFGVQKNRALDLAQGDWVLALDADEWLSAELARAIGAAVGEQAPFSAYALARSSSFCGRTMRHSGWWPDPVVRLFRRDRARFSEDLVHERLLVQGPVGRLDGLLHHESFTDLGEVVDKMNAYSSAGARMLRSRGRRGGLRRALWHGAWAFLRTYVLRAGFLDGREGFVLALANAEGTYYRYLKAALGPLPR